MRQSATGCSIILLAALFTGVASGCRPSAPVTDRGGLLGIIREASHPRVFVAANQPGVTASVQCQGAGVVDYTPDLSGCLRFSLGGSTDHGGVRYRLETAQGISDCVGVTGTSGSRAEVAWLAADGSRALVSQGQTVWEITASSARSARVVTYADGIAAWAATPDRFVYVQRSRPRQLRWRPLDGSHDDASAEMTLPEAPDRLLPGRTGEVLAIVSDDVIVRGWKIDLQARTLARVSLPGDPVFDLLFTAAGDGYVEIWDGRSERADGTRVMSLASPSSSQPRRPLTATI